MNHSDENGHFDTAHLDEDIAGHTVRGGALTAAAQVFKSILEIGSTLILARILAPADFGLIGMVIAVTGFIALFKDLGLSMATIQRRDITHEQISTLFWINVLLSVVILVLTVAISPILAWFYDEPRLIWITIGLAGAFIFSGLTVQHDALLRRQMRFGAVAGAELAALALSLGLAIWMALDGWSYWALVARHVLAAIVMAGAVWWLCSWRPGRPGRFSEIRSMLAYGGNLTGFSVVNYFARNLDDVLIGRFHGAGPLGLYQKAYEILMVPIKQINNPVSAVAIPALSRLVDQPERYRKAYLRILEKVLLLTMPLAALLIATADWVVLLALGPQWTESAQIFAVLGILVFIQPLGNSTGWLFITQDRTREMLRWGVLGSTLSIISFLVGLPWGVIGVAAAYAISGLVVRTPILLWYVGRRGPVRTVDFYKRCAPFALSGVVTLGVLLQMRALEVVTHPAAGLAIALALTLVTMPTVLAIFPGGRDAMRDAMAIATRLAARRGSR